MNLTKISVAGFRSLVDVEIEFDSLTVLIGENDSGKSSVLDILEMFLGNKSPDENDYHQDINEKPVDRIEVVLEFRLGKNDVEARQFGIDDKLKVKKIYHRKNSEVDTFYWGEKPTDKRLLQDITNLLADEQKELIKDIDPSIEDSEISNGTKRKKVFNDLIEAAPKTAGWLEPPSSRWGSFLPIFQRYSAMDYKAPANMVATTLKQIFWHTIFEQKDDDGENRELIKPLRDVQRKAKKKILSEILDLKEYIQKYNKRVRDIGYEPVFDFSRSLKTGEFTIDLGRGLHALSKTGDGTKRRMFMAFLDWDREVSIEQAKDGNQLPYIIRGYDEPDTNLHYEAQRLMYQAISDIVGAVNSNIDAILCTHSMTMIDRAPAHNIRLMSLDENGYSRISQLHTNDDPEVEQFLINLARELGITNSLIFYERCFILIEGETEKNALPILYKKLYGRSMFEDCISIINVKGNGAVKEFLRLLSRNRQNLTLIFLDSDANETRTAQLTEEVLAQSGFSAEFIANHVLYIGDAEFEDAFSDRVISNCLQTSFPKREDCWCEDDIAPLREDGKFSKNLKKKVWECSEIDTRNWRKPDFGKLLAQQCDLDDIPDEISLLFEKAREIARI